MQRTEADEATDSSRPCPGLYKRGTWAKKEAGGQVSLSAIFHSSRSITSCFFLQLLSLSADCKSAHHLWLAVEAKPNGDGVSSSPACFGSGALAAESLGRGHTTQDGWCSVSPPHAGQASKHLTCIQSFLIHHPRPGNRQVLLGSPFYRRSRGNTKWPHDCSRSHTADCKNCFNHLLG